MNADWADHSHEPRQFGLGHGKGKCRQERASPGASRREAAADINKHRTETATPQCLSAGPTEFSWLADWPTAKGERLVGRQSLLQLENNRSDFLA